MRSKNPEANRYVTIALLAGPAALALAYVFHAVYANLSQTAAAIGYVDPATTTGIFLGYIAMAGGACAFGAIAVWAAARYVAILMRERRSR